MATNKPMTDEEIAAIRALLYEDEGVGDIAQRLESDWASVRYNAGVNVAGRNLLAEMERLRAENAAMREMVQVLAGDDTYTNSWAEDCRHCGDGWRYSHSPDCIIVKARALVAQWEVKASSHNDNDTEDVDDAAIPDETEGNDNSGSVEQQQQQQEGEGAA